MGKLHFDPVDLDDQCRRRHNLNRYEPSWGLFEQIAETRAAFERKGSRVPTDVEATIADLEAAVVASPRECDPILDNLFYFTDPSGWAERIAETPHWQKAQHRIAVHSRVNQAGNLTVRFEPAFVAEDGFARAAREWRDMPYLGGARVAERPDDEILYIRGVRGLFGCHAQSLVRRDARYAKLAEAVSTVFWLTVHRLVRRFDVYLLSYVTRLTNNAGDVEYGLEIVDAREDTLRALRGFIADFQARHGCDVQTFWQECKIAESKGGSTYDLVSRCLRVKGSPTQHLTPSVCRDLHDQLARAFRLGATHEPRAVVVTSVSGTDLRLIESKSYKEAYSAQKSALAPSPRSEKKIDHRVDTKTEAQRRALPLRQPELDPAVGAEFGVNSVAGLVEYANNRLALLGRKPLAEGDYPTGRSSLRRLIKLLRGLPEK